MNTDVVTPGQWIRARVNVRRCDVTPDGRLLVAGLYDADSHRDRNPDVHPSTASGWTAISRPPYFTALALWFDQSGQGGHWSSTRDLHLFGHHTKDAPDKGALRSGIRRAEATDLASSDQRPFEIRLRRDGWEELEKARYLRIEHGWRNDRKIVAELNESGINLAPLEAMRRGEFPYSVQIGKTRWQLPFASGRLLRDGTGESQETQSLLEESGEVRLSITHSWNSWGWIDLDELGRVIYGNRGCLWAWENFPEGEPKLVADLNANRFESIAPPDWAREWPTNGVPEW